MAWQRPDCEPTQLSRDSQQLASAVRGIMSRLFPMISLTCSIALCVALGGCAGAFLVGGLGAAAGGGYIAGHERGFDGTYNDFAVKTNIEQAFLSTNPLLQQGVTASVYEGRVLLSGRVASPELKAHAKRLASAVPGTRALYDEIEVAPTEGVWDDVHDSWINARIRSGLVLDPDIRAANYTIDTENRSVYLIGSARSQLELDRAIAIARSVPGVKRVVSYVEIRSGVPLAGTASREFN